MNSTTVLGTRATPSSNHTAYYQLKGCGDLYSAKYYFVSEKSRFFPQVVEEYKRIQQQNIPHSSFDYLFKFVMISDYGVGKSAFLLRLVDDIFSECFDSTIRLS